MKTNVLENSNNVIQNGHSPTINTCQGGERQPKVLVHLENMGTDNIVNNENNDSLYGYRIRKLTPKECWRLQGFRDIDFEKAKWMSEEESEEFLKKHPKSKCKRNPQNLNQIERTSDSQLYKQAGNAIVVDVLYYIYKEIYKAMPYLFDDLKVGSFFSGIGSFEKALDRLYEDINNAT